MIKKGLQVGNALLYRRYKVDFGHRVDCNGFSIFKCNHSYHFIRKTILNGDDMTA